MTNSFGGDAFSNITSAATNTVRTGSGILRRVVNNRKVAGGVVTIYDNTAASGTKIGTITNPGTLLNNSEVYEYGLRFGTGLTVVTSAADDITVVFAPTT